ncbi:MAG: branched-chain amino acid transaminase [Anaerolineae bacterium]
MVNESLPQYVWMTGSLRPWNEAMVHVSLLGHATVSGVFEGIRGYQNHRDGQVCLFRLREHMERLLESMKIVRMDHTFTVDGLCKGLVDLVRANGYRCDVNALVLAYYGGLTWSFAQPELHRPVEVAMRCRSVNSRLLTDKGIHCCISTWTRISEADLPPRAKCVSNYHNGRLASMEAQLNGYDQALLLDHQGKVAEAPGACLFMVRKGAVVTPPTTSSILESITRATLIQLFAEQLGLTVQERPVDRSELYIADELFLCGTAFEVTPIAEVDHYPVGKGEVGEITRRISHVYHDVVRGVDPRHSEWRTPVWSAL